MRATSIKTLNIVQQHNIVHAARAYHRVLKLSRTIADLAGQEKIAASHLAEALQYRPRMNED